MANWAYIENNEIREVTDELPKNWRNVSNLDALESNLEMLKTLGWYPVAHNKIDYDPNIQILKTVNVIYNGKQVVETYTVENIPNEHLYTKFMEELRIKRNELLKESDYMCLYDLITLKGEKYLNEVTKYRQLLRDLPDQYSIINFPYNIMHVKWPLKPELIDYPNVGGVL